MKKNTRSCSGALQQDLGREQQAEAGVHRSFHAERYIFNF